MPTLILKHANKNRLGAIDWGPDDFDVLAKMIAVSVEYFCHCRHRKGAHGSGRSQLANTRRDP